jgi:hypothetical protein
MSNKGKGYDGELETARLLLAQIILATHGKGPDWTRIHWMLVEAVRQQVATIVLEVDDKKTANETP